MTPGSGVLIVDMNLGCIFPAGQYSKCICDVSKMYFPLLFHKDGYLVTEGKLEDQVKTKPKQSDDLNPSCCILAKIKKEIEEDFAINEALLFDEESSREEESVLVKQDALVDNQFVCLNSRYFAK